MIEKSEGASNGGPACIANFPIGRGLSQISSGRDRTTSVGYAPAHHGEILQGVFRDQGGALHRGLVTMPHPHLEAVAWVAIAKDRQFTVEPSYKLKVLAAVHRLATLHPDEILPCRIRLKSNIQDGFGLGSSTADIFASLRAVANLFRIRLRASDYFRIAVEAEKASDGIMFRHKAALVAHREGRVLDIFPGRLPDFGLISLNSDPSSPVSTNDFVPARYSIDEIDHFEYLRRLLAKAVLEQRVDLIGIVATDSARINQSHLPQTRFDEVLTIGRDAIGVQVAHSGRVVGLLVPPGMRRADRPIGLIMGGLREIGFVPSFFSGVR